MILDSGECDMSKLYFKAFKLCIFISVLGLGACNSQPVKQAAEEKKATQASEEVAQPVESAAKAVISEPETPQAEISPPKEASQPIVEVTPQKSVADHDIVIEQIPATREPVIASEKPGEKSSTDSKAKLVSTGPNHFVITTAVKDASHPFYGKGDPSGFLVNGIAGKEFVIERGQTYMFEVDTGPRHDVYLSKKEIGWGGAPLTKGVEGAYINKGKMTFKPTADTPNNVYYACRDHPYMGGTIHVVNPGEKIVLKERVAPSPTKKLAGSSATAAKVKQKLVFAEMMVNSKTAQRITDSQNAEAKKILEQAKKSLAEGKEKSKAGALSEALEMFDAALKMMREARRLVPSTAEITQLAENYKETLAEIKDFQKSHKDNLALMEKAGAVSDEARYDEKAFALTLVEAQSQADKKDYVKANALLKKAKEVVTVALHKMLDSKTLVYDLNFKTPADEYAYELKRFSGYEELIPIAIETKKPAAGAIKLIDSFVNKGRKRRDEAQGKADAGDYDAAIGMVQQATKSIRRALRMAGVTQ